MQISHLCTFRCDNTDGVKAPTWPLIQSANSWLRLAWALVNVDGPVARRISALYATCRSCECVRLKEKGLEFSVLAATIVTRPGGDAGHRLRSRTRATGA